MRHEVAGALQSLGNGGASSLKLQVMQGSCSDHRMVAALL